MITRRDFLHMTGGAAAVGLGSAARRAADAQPPQREASMPAERPNVIVFFTDQQRWDTVGVYGSPMDLTPNLDAMARRGTLFHHAFTCQPVCAPARASLQTGRYATATGVWRNGIALREDEQTLAHWFKAAGYQTGYIGKWHLAKTSTKPVPESLRGGYEYWLASDVLEFTSHPYDVTMFDNDNQPVKLPGYRVDACTDAAVQFVKDRADSPFFLFLSFLEPHHQNDMNTYVAPEGYAEKYADPHIPQDLLMHPGDWFKELPSYYGIVARLDECLGRLLSTLDELNLTDNTVVLFTSDHGSHFRTRNNEYKRSCHDACTRIPLVAQGPGLNRAQVVPEPVSLVDVPATLLEAAGLPAPETMHGRSLLPLARREAADWPEEVFMQISESMVARAIRTDRWKYCVYAPDKRGGQDAASDAYVEYQIYDLAADPHEQVNLIGRRQYRDVFDDLRDRLLRRLTEAGEPAAKIEPATHYA